MNILSIETATEWCGVALIKKSECVINVEKYIPRQHAEKLPLFYEEVRKKVSLDDIPLDCIAISIGPGSFTGLRVGLGFAKGLAFAKGLPIVPVSTMQVIAAKSEMGEKEFSVLLYSHRDVVYTQKFLGIQQKLEPKVIHWNEKEKSEVYIQYGCEKLMKDKLYTSVPPSAEFVGKLAEKQFDKLVVDKPYELVPNYISPFEIN